MPFFFIKKQIQDGRLAVIFDRFYCTICTSVPGIPIWLGWFTWNLAWYWHLVCSWCPSILIFEKIQDGHLAVILNRFYCTIWTSGPGSLIWLYWFTWKCLKAGDSHLWWPAFSLFYYIFGNVLVLTKWYNRSTWSLFSCLSMFCTSS